MSGEENHPREEFSDIFNANEWLDNVKSILETKYDCQEEIDLAIEWFRVLASDLMTRNNFIGDEVDYFKRIASGLELSEKRIRAFANFYNWRQAKLDDFGDDIIFDQFNVLYSIEKR